MKKVLSMLLVLSMVSVLFIGCGKKAAEPAENSEVTTEAAKATTEAATEATAEAPLIAFICKDLSQEWFVGTSSAMKETAMSLGAKDVLLFDTAMSPDKYMTALDSAISQGVDVLIVCPPDQQLSQVTVDRCKEAGIKVMADDDGLIDENGKHIAPALELDAYVVGSSQGEWLATYYKDNKLSELKDKTAYMVMTMDEVSSCVPRAAGALDTFLKITPDFAADKVIKANYDGTADKGFNVVAATITANPDITHWIVTAPNDEGAQGATRALEQAGIDKDACVVGLGGYLGLDELKKDYSAFKAFAYIDPLLDGKIAATAAMAWATEGVVAYSEYIKDGEEFGLYPFGAVMADKTNYQVVMGVE
ncbi:MAG: substrate-binding domain-containing protein [Vallitaleaceae bacterium]|nr:substrate-binding domain-containing protein [Vallitaleaceae bacterium]